MKKLLLKKKIYKKEIIDNEIKFIIIMPTYNRLNGKTIFYLKRSIESIKNQIYKNWILIIVGDKYEPEEELLNIINKYDKIIYIKNTNVERDYITNKKNLWHCAGATSNNIGLEYARNNNYKYYCHLDDDDYWSEEHLFEIANIYNKYENCIFVNTKSTYINSYLPLEDIKIYKNNRLPISYKTIHSSISFKIDILPFYYKTTFNKDGINKPSDALLLNDIKNFIEKNNKYCSIYISKLTCYHDEEYNF